MIKNNWKCHREGAKIAKTDAKNEIFSSDLRALRAFALIIEFSSEKQDTIGLQCNGKGEEDGGVRAVSVF